MNKTHDKRIILNIHSIRFKHFKHITITLFEIHSQNRLPFFLTEESFIFITKAMRKVSTTKNVFVRIVQIDHRMFTNFEA